MSDPTAFPAVSKPPARSRTGLSLSLPASVSASDTADRRHGLAFGLLVFFIFIVFVAPQAMFPVLVPLRLARVSMILALASFLGQRWSRGLPAITWSRDTRLLAIFVGIAVASIPLSMWPGGSVGLLTDMFGKSLVLYLLTTELLTSVARVWRLVSSTILFCIIVSILALMGYQSGALVEGYRLQGGMAGINSNPNDFALTLNLVIPFALALLIGGSPGRRLLAAGFLVLATAGILFSYSRAGFLTLVFILPCSLLAIVRRPSRFLVPLLLITVTLFLLLPGDYGDRLLSILDMSKDRSGSSEARWEDAGRALSVIAAHPLLGVGLGMNVLALNEEGGDWGQVHNVYLEIAAEIGIPGLVAFLALVFYLLRSLRAIRLRLGWSSPHHDLRALAGACETSLLAFCFAALFHPVAYHFYFYFVAGIAAALIRLGTVPAVRDRVSAAAPGPVLR
jgi:putative inorganic carbon (hco3(-)) transporter